MLVLKFKPTPKSEPAYLESGLICNGHWLFDCAWLESLKSAVSLPARKMLERRKVLEVGYRLNGQYDRKKGLQTLVKGAQGIDLKELDLLQATFSAAMTGLGLTRVKVAQGEIEFCLDPAYLPILFFDPEASIYFRSNTEAISIHKTGQVVALIMPLRA